MIILIISDCPRDLSCFNSNKDVNAYITLSITLGLDW